MTFFPNRNFADELERQPEVAAAKRAAAELVARNATENVRAIGRPGVLTPWMPHKGSQPIEVEVDHGQVYVVNTQHGSALQEWGGRNNSPHAPLRRAVRQAGLLLDET